MERRSQMTAIADMHAFFFESLFAGAQGVARAPIGCFEQTARSKISLGIGEVAFVSLRLPRSFFPYCAEVAARPGLINQPKDSSAKASSANGSRSGILQDPFAMSVRARAT